MGHDPCLTQSLTFFNREGIGVVAVMSRAPLARLRELVARHPQFSVALAVGAILRLVAMLGYPGALWFAGDSYVYVGAALRPTPDQSKTTGYSLFLRALLPFHSFTLVTGLQHLMGLGIAVMVYVLARRAGVSKLWATAATLPVLLDGFEIEDEHMVMAEALFTFLIMLAMLLILWRSRTSWVTALIAGLLVGYAVVVRSEGLPILVLFPAYLLWRGRRSWRGWLAAAVMAVGCAAPVLAYGTWFDHVQGSFTLSRADGFFLWGRVSSFAECSVIKPPADELQICPSGSPSSRTAPGDYIWHFQPVHQLPGGPVSPANDRLLRDFAIRAIEAQPFGYAKAVVKGLALSVEWPRHKYPDSGTVGYYNFTLYTQWLPNNTNHEWIAGGTAYQDAVSYGHASPSRVVRAVRVSDHFVPADPLHLRPAVRADHGRGARRTGADRGAQGTAAAAGLVPPGGQHAALDHRRRAACLPDRHRRLRLPVPAPGAAVRQPGRGPRVRPGPGPPRPAAVRPGYARAAAGRRAEGRPDQPGPRPGQLTWVHQTVP